MAARFCICWSLMHEFSEVARNSQKATNCNRHRAPEESLGRSPGAWYMYPVSVSSVSDLSIVGLRVDGTVASPFFGFIPHVIPCILCALSHFASFFHGLVAPFFHAGTLRQGTHGRAGRDAEYEVKQISFHTPHTLALTLPAGNFLR